MSDQRPDPLQLQDELADVRAFYGVVHAMAVGDTGSSALTDFITGTADPGVPINEVLLDKLRPIDAEVNAYALILTEETSRTPTGHATQTLLAWLSSQVWHFTGHDNAQIAYGFADDVSRWRVALKAIADPDGWTPLDLPVACVEDCDGHYVVRINREDAVPYEQAPMYLKAKDARCSKNPEHVMRVGMMEQVRRWEIARKQPGEAA